MGILYLIQPAELVGTKRYKIGCSNKSTLERVKKGYKVGSRYLHIMECNNPLKIEKLIKFDFNNHFTLIAGSEYFEGDEEEMKKIFYEKYSEYSQQTIDTVKMVKEKKEKKPKRPATEKQLASLKKARETKEKNKREKILAEQKEFDIKEHAEFMKNFMENSAYLNISPFESRSSFYPGSEKLKHYVKKKQDKEAEEIYRREEKERKITNEKQKRIDDEQRRIDGLKEKMEYFKSIGLNCMTCDQRHEYFQLKGYDNLDDDDMRHYVQDMMFGGY